jgi:hypothetical protein
MLPGDVLLEIFDHHRLVSLESLLFGTWDWYKLTHVCRRWRAIIFGSPGRLELRLVHTYQSPVRNNLDWWPDLPLSIWYPRLYLHHPLSRADEENIITALKYPGRICEINLTLTHPLLEMLTPLMRDPFPVLEDLHLNSRDLDHSLVLPSTFLGGSTPRLCRVVLDCTPFPTLPQLIVTARDLVTLQLSEIPHTGYFSPEALVNGLNSTPKLKFLNIGWASSTSRPDQQSSPCSPCPQTHVALPALTEFQFRGDNEYLEDLIAKIDTPNVERFNVTLFDQGTFDLPQLIEFICRTEELMSSPHRTSIYLLECGFSITHHFGSSPFAGQRTFQLQISFHELTLLMKLLTHVCRQLSPLLSNVGWLNIEANVKAFDWLDQTDATQWLGLFFQFGGVRKLELIHYQVQSAALALEQSASNTDLGLWEVLPSLRDLHLRGFDNLMHPVRMESFLAARQRSDRAVALHRDTPRYEMMSIRSRRIPPP